MLGSEPVDQGGSPLSTLLLGESTAIFFLTHRRMGRWS